MSQTTFRCFVCEVCLKRVDEFGAAQTSSEAYVLLLFLVHLVFGCHFCYLVVSHYSSKSLDFVGL